MSNKANLFGNRTENTRNFTESVELSERENNPFPATNQLYNLGSELYWNGEQVAAGSGISKWNQDGTTIHPEGTNIDVAIGKTTAAGGNKLDVSGNARIDGNLQVTGDVTSVEQLEVEDSLIGLAIGNQTDSLDIGFVGEYEEDSTKKHAGLYRDSSTDTFKFFKGSEQSNITTAQTVDSNATGYELAGIEGGPVKSLSQDGFTTNTDIGRRGILASHEGSGAGDYGGTIYLSQAREEEGTKRSAVALTARHFDGGGSFGHDRYNLEIYTKPGVDREDPLNRAATFTDLGKLCLGTFDGDLAGRLNVQFSGNFTTSNAPDGRGIFIGREGSNAGDTGGILYLSQARTLSGSRRAGVALVSKHDVASFGDDRYALEIYTKNDSDFDGPLNKAATFSHDGGLFVEGNFGAANVTSSSSVNGQAFNANSLFVAQHTVLGQGIEFENSMTTSQPRLHRRSDNELYWGDKILSDANFFDVSENTDLDISGMTNTRGVVRIYKRVGDTQKSIQLPELSSSNLGMQVEITIVDTGSTDVEVRTHDTIELILPAVGGHLPPFYNRLTSSDKMHFKPAGTRRGDVMVLKATRQKNNSFRWVGHAITQFENAIETN